MSSRVFAALSTAALAVTLAAAPASAGSIKGKVVFGDQAPKLRPISMDADPVCASKHDSPVYPDVLVLGDGNTMANVFVQVTNPPQKDYPAPSKAVIIDQHGCQYIPHVVGVMVGQPLMFKNSDGILHNVHGMPEVNREFNIGMPPTLKEKDHVFTKPEAVFPVKCDVHPWMRAFAAVMTHPFFAVTGKDGTYTIDGLPPGTYEVTAWHEKLGTKTASVTVGDGAAKADFEFKVPK